VNPNGILSPWWLALPAGLLLAFLLSLLVMHGRRIASLAIASLVICLALGVLLVLSYRYTMCIDILANVAIGDAIDMRNDHIWLSYGAIRTGSFTGRVWGKQAEAQARTGPSRIQWIVYTTSRVAVLPLHNPPGWKAVAKWKGFFEATAREPLPPPTIPSFRDSATYYHGYICAFPIWPLYIPLSFFPLFWVFRRYRIRHLRQRGFPVLNTSNPAR